MGLTRMWARERLVGGLLGGTAPVKELRDVEPGGVLQRVQDGADV